MTFKTIEILTCDRCGTQFKADTESKRRAQRAYARLAGWTTRWATNRTMDDWCDRCSHPSSEANAR